MTILMVDRNNFPPYNKYLFLYISNIEAPDIKCKSACVTHLLSIFTGMDWFLKWNQIPRCNWLLCCNRLLCCNWLLCCNQLLCCNWLFQKEITSVKVFDYPKKCQNGQVIGIMITCNQESTQLYSLLSASPSIPFRGSAKCEVTVALEGRDYWNVKLKVT